MQAKTHIRNRTMPTTHYTFEFDGVNAGHFEVSDDGHTVFMNARFEMNGELNENRFWYEYEGNRVPRFRVAEGPWTDLPENVYPTSAYPLLLPRVKDRLTYEAWHEGENRSLGETELIRDGDEIREVRDGKIERRFWLRDGAIVKIDWGGAVSKVVRDEG